MNSTQLCSSLIAPPNNCIYRCGFLITSDIVNCYYMAKRGRKKKEKLTAWHKAATVFTTSLVVIGIAVIAWLASNSPAPSPESTEPVAQAPTSTAPNPEQAWLIVTPSSTKLMSLDSKREIKLNWPDDVKRLNQPVSQLKGIDLASRKTVWLDPEFKIASSSSMRSPDGRREASLQVDPDKTMLAVSYGTDVQRQPLRRKNGDALTNVQLIGWTDPQKVAIVADHSTTTKAIYLVNTSNGTELIQEIPNTVTLFTTSDKNVYYVQNTKAETDIESSAVYQVNEQGSTQKLEEIQRREITSLIARENIIAFQTDDKKLYLNVAGESYELNMCQPLLLTKDERVFCDEGWRYALVGTEKQLMDLPKQGAIFYTADAFLDEVPQIQ